MLAGSPRTGRVRMNSLRDPSQRPCLPETGRASGGLQAATVSEAASVSKAARVLTTECLLRQGCRPAPTARAALPAAEEPGRCRSRPSETVTGQEYFLSHCRPQRPRLVEATSNPLFSAFTLFLSFTFSLLSECPVWVPAVGRGGGVGVWGRHTGEQNRPAITGLTTRWAPGLADGAVGRPKDGDRGDSGREHRTRMPHGTLGPGLSESFSERCPAGVLHWAGRGRSRGKEGKKGGMQKEKLTCLVWSSWR